MDRKKNMSANAGDIRNMGSNPGLGRSPREGHGNPLQYSYLENPMDRGDWGTTHNSRGGKELDNLATEAT